MIVFHEKVFNFDSLVEFTVTGTIYTKNGEICPLKFLDENLQSLGWYFVKWSAPFGT